MIRNEVVINTGGSRHDHEGGIGMTWGGGRCGYLDER